ncbi:MULTISPECIES: hypothetical protein [unclassified Yoonia]|uniref:hypothetical protein n=1 Tax=unclassified Yoonia TaxID=2629118 RepID=UPI002AFDFCFF|nr:MULTISPECIES: hypothetical protein [unclassified Yoonia]
MTQPTLTQSRLHAGLWEALLEGADHDAPSLTATHEGRAVPDLHCVPGPQDGTWRISLPIPAHVLNDGLQTIVISLADGTKIGSLAILAGAPLADDLRAEIDLLRSELDLLKSAFRRRVQEN